MPPWRGFGEHGRVLGSFWAVLRAFGLVLFVFFVVLSYPRSLKFDLNFDGSWDRFWKRF